MITFEQSLIYSKVLYDLPASSLQERLYTLQQLDGIFQQSAVRLFFLSPQVPLKKKEELLDSALQSCDDKPLREFLKLLLRKNLFGGLSAVVEEFRHRVYKKLGWIEVHLTTAVSIYPAAKAGLEKKLETLHGKKVVMSCDIDPNLIGGGILTIGDKTVDFSIRDKLRTLKRQLSSD